MIEALYPQLKKQFIASGRDSKVKSQILGKFRSNGFYLLDLSDVPRGMLRDPLASQLPSLGQKVERLVNKETKIILIKSNVYDLAFPYLKNLGFKNIVDKRIPFPGSGQQKKFQRLFREALRA